MKWSCFAVFLGELAENPSSDEIRMFTKCKWLVQGGAP
jgi:hypothetical protein